jgi:hypothetical protein
MAKSKKTQRSAAPGKGKAKGSAGAGNRAGSNTGARGLGNAWNRSAGWYLSAAVGVLVTAIAVYLLIGYCGWMPTLVAPLVAGLIAGLIADETVRAAAVGAVGGLLGGLAVGHDYAERTLKPLVEQQPAYANLDALGKHVYEWFLVPLYKGGAILSAPGPRTTLLFATVFTPVVAVGTVWVVRNLPDAEKAKAFIGWCVVLMLGLILVTTGWHYGERFRTTLGQHLGPSSFAHDSYVYRNTFEYMLEGNGFYASLVKAGANDKRLAEGKLVHDGKFYGFITSPVLAREPGAFYLWRVFAPNGPPGVSLLALLTCAAVLGVVHWGLKQVSLPASLLAPVLLLPMFELQCTWANIFFPDFWAGLAMLASVSLLIRERMMGAIVLALVAALFRETLVFWLGALLVLSVLRVKSSPGGRRDLVAAAGALVVFGALYALHFYQASQIIAQQTNTGAGGFIARLQQSAATPVEVRFLNPLSYMMWPYGFFRFPTAWIAAAGVVGWIVSFGKRPALRWTVAAYAVFWMVYYATIGAASGYWGQQVLPFYLVGFAMLVTLAYRTDEPGATA